VNYDGAKQLLDAGANKTLKSADGKTPPEMINPTNPTNSTYSYMSVTMGVIAQEDKGRLMDLFGYKFSVDKKVF
jgi:hypothetical protein